jgi:hypothetical protein
MHPDGRDAASSMNMPARSSTMLSSATNNACDPTAPLPETNQKAMHIDVASSLRSDRSSHANRHVVPPVASGSHSS